MMILMNGENRLPSLSLSFSANLFCPSNLQAESLTSRPNGSLALVMWRGGVALPGTSYGYQLLRRDTGIDVISETQRGVRRLSKAIDKKNDQERTGNSGRFRYLLSKGINLLKVDMGCFFSNLVCEFVENGAIFLSAVFVIYAPLFLAEREVER